MFKSGRCPRCVCRFPRTPGSITARTGVGSARDPRRRNKIEEDGSKRLGEKKTIEHEFPSLYHQRPRIIHFVRSFFPSKKQTLSLPTRSHKNGRSVFSWQGLANGPGSVEQPGVFFLVFLSTRRASGDPHLLMPHPPWNQILELVNQATQYKQLKKGC
jgi:hypothetical protein